MIEKEIFAKNKHFSPLFEKIEEILKTSLPILAIEGGSGSGKTTLAKLLSQAYESTVFHIDDFFLPPEKRTNSRLSEIGGNMDRERFLSQVLIPLSKGDDVFYRPFDCKTATIKEGEIIKPKGLIIIEGAYSMHPDLAPYYSLSVFLDIDKTTQKKRILNRNTKELATRFFKEWIPLEDVYFEKTNAKNRCDLIINISDH